MKIMQEFKNFALRGNVVDLAVGVIIGAAFGKIVDSMVNDLIMPIAGIFGNSDFSNFYLGLSAPARAAADSGMSLAKAREAGIGPIFAYGHFITVALNFLILAFIIFLMVKAMNKMMRKEEAAKPVEPPKPTLQETLLMEIRDELKNK